MARTYDITVGPTAGPQSHVVNLTDSRGLSDVVQSSWVRAGAAPLAPYAVGTEVGVPTGTTLTDRPGNALGTQTHPDEVMQLTDPETGEVGPEITVRPYRNLRWTDTLQQAPLADGIHVLLQNCAIDMQVDGFFCIDFETYVPGRVENRLTPVLILDHCTLDGNQRTGKALAAHRFWADHCDVGGAEDGGIGSAFSTIYRSNFSAGINLTQLVDPHPDGLQLTDTGNSLFYETFFNDAGLTGAQQSNSMLRVGTESGAVDDVSALYCGFAGGATQTVQFRGDAGNAPITGIRFKGCRWCDDDSGFLYDFQQNSGGPTMIDLWEDNSRGTDGTVGGLFMPAGTVIERPPGV